MTRAHADLMLASDWQTHLATPFPGPLRGVEVDGIDLVSLDADASGYIQTYLAGRRPLDARYRDGLERCRRDLSAVAGILSGDGAGYYERLLNIVERVLEDRT